MQHETALACLAENRRDDVTVPGGATVYGAPPEASLDAEAPGSPASGFCAFAGITLAATSPEAAGDALAGQETGVCEAGADDADAGACEGAETGDDVAARAVEWVDSQLGALKALIFSFAQTKARGQPPIARVWMRDVVLTEDDAHNLARSALAALASQCLKNEVGLTNCAGVVGEVAGETMGKEFSGNREQIAVGVWLISAIAETTGGVEIRDKHGDRPNKVEGGVKVTPEYELHFPDSSNFLADAIRLGKVGMPTFSLDGVDNWTGQTRGGAPGQAGGMMHKGEKQMKGVNHNSAPDLFAAVNAAQAVEFRVAEFPAKVVKDYNEAKARKWLFDHFLSLGMDPDKANVAAAEAARL